MTTEDRTAEYTQRRQQLEGLLHTYDHPQLWSDQDLERMYRERCMEADDIRMTGGLLPGWARDALELRRGGVETR